MTILQKQTNDILDNELEARANALVDSAPGSEEDVQAVLAFKELSSIKRENEKAKSEEKKGILDTVLSFGGKIIPAFIGLGLGVWYTKYQYDREFADDPQIPRSQTSKSNQSYVQSLIKKGL